MDTQWLNVSLLVEGGRRGVRQTLTRKSRVIKLCPPLVSNIDRVDGKHQLVMVVVRWSGHLSRCVRRDVITIDFGEKVEIN